MSVNPAAMPWHFFLRRESAGKPQELVYPHLCEARYPESRVCPLRDRPTISD